MINKDGTCPSCHTSWDGGSILDTFKQQRDSGVHWKGYTDAQLSEAVKEGYSPPYRWSRLIGIELPYDHPNHYDGISYWQCPDCKTTWDRFTGKEVSEI